MNRLNDVWVFDAISQIWHQPNKLHNDESSKPFQLSSTAWPNAPPPRASHSATLVGSILYIFGGYGGSGYSRRDLDDLYALDTIAWTWSKVQTKGSPPEKRSSHQACGVGSRIYIIGGCSSSGQYQVRDIQPYLYSVLVVHLWIDTQVKSLTRGVGKYHLFYVNLFYVTINKKNQLSCRSDLRQCTKITLLNSLFLTNIIAGRVHSRHRHRAASLVQAAVQFTG